MSGYDKPKSYPSRSITDTSVKNGKILNPPKLPEIGGANSLHKGGIKKNSMSIRKPGGAK